MLSLLSQSVLHRLDVRKSVLLQKNQKNLRQHRTKIAVQTHSQLFRQIAQNDAGMPAYFKEFWAK